MVILLMLSSFPQDICQWVFCLQPHPAAPWGQDSLGKQPFLQVWHCSHFWRWEATEDCVLKQKSHFNSIKMIPYYMCSHACTYMLYSWLVCLFIYMWTLGAENDMSLIKSTKLTYLFNFLSSVRFPPDLVSELIHFFFWVCCLSVYQSSCLHTVILFFCLKSSSRNVGFSFLIPQRRLVVSLTMLSISPSTLDTDGLSRLCIPRQWEALKEKAASVGCALPFSWHFPVEELCPCSPERSTQLTGTKGQQRTTLLSSCQGTRNLPLSPLEWTLSSSCKGVCKGRLSSVTATLYPECLL